MLTHNLIPRTPRMATLTLLLVMTYVLLVIAPFFMFGIHTVPRAYIYSGMLDPKSPSLYGDSSILEVTYAVMWFVPVLGIATAIVLGRQLLIKQAQLTRWHRILTGAAILAGTSMTVFAVSPLGRTIYTWLMD
jgi:hypothetical protein